MRELPAQNHLFQFLGWRRQGRVSLAEGDHLKAIGQQLREQLCGVPRVEANLANPESPGVSLNARPDHVIDDVAFRCLDASFLNPDVVRDSVIFDAPANVVPRHPESAENFPGFSWFDWWKDQHECG